MGYQNTNNGTVSTSKIAAICHCITSDDNEANDKIGTKEIDFVEEGIGSLFKGLSASLLTVSNAIVYFPLYEGLKELLGVNEPNGFSSVKIALSSTIAKTFASSLTYPLVVVRTVLQDHKHKHNGSKVGEKLSFLDVVKHIRQENGLSGFYSGLKPDLVRLVPSNAITFLCYEYIRRYWLVYITPHFKE